MPTFKDKLKQIQRNLSASLEVETDRIAGIVKKAPLDKIRIPLPNVKNKEDAANVPADTSKQKSDQLESVAAIQNQPPVDIRAQHNSPSPSNRPAPSLADIEEPPLHETPAAEIPSKAPHLGTQFDTVPSNPSDILMQQQNIPLSEPFNTGAQEMVGNQSATFAADIDVSPVTDSAPAMEGVPPPSGDIVQEIPLTAPQDTFAMDQLLDSNVNSDAPIPFPDLAFQGQDTFDPTLNESLSSLPPSEPVPDTAQTDEPGDISSFENLNVDSDTEKSEATEKPIEEATEGTGAGGSDGDSLLDLFRSEDVEENPITDLALTLPDVDIHNLLEKAKLVAKEIKGEK